MKNFNKILAAVLLAAMIILVSCNSNEGGGSDSNVVENNTESVVETAEETVAEIEFPHENFEWVSGRGDNIFKILIDKQWSGNSLDIADYDIEESTGEVLNDAIYMRNLIIEENFNIKLEGVRRDDDMESFVNRTMRAGLDEYDAMAPRLMNAAKFAASGYGVNVHETALTLDAPWWDPNIIADTSIAGAAYMFAGDIFTYHYDGIAMLMFNKRLLGDLGLESPYRLVENNQWTLDNFNNLVRGVYLDVNQNGSLDREDRFGFVTQADYVTSFVNGSGERFISKDSDDLPQMPSNFERLSAILDKMLDVYETDTYCMHRDAYGREGGSGQLVQFWVFPHGRALFYWAFPRYMDLGLRDMEDDFGIVPIPKWDSNQSRYYATLSHWHSYTFMIPVTVSDVDRNSVVLDAMAYHGRRLIRPAYYDVCLQRKYTRDDDSSAMLDIIFGSTVYDLGFVYNFGSWVSTIESDIQKNSINLMSIYERQENRIETDIYKIIDQFLENR